MQRGILALVGLAVATAGCGTKPDRPLSVAEVASPAPSGSGEGNLAVGADGRLYLSWVAKEADGHVLQFSRWEEDHWSSPVAIARGTDWFVNWADFPGMIALVDGTLWAHWLVKSGPDSYAYGIRIARSTDGGTTWSEPVSPHRDSTQTEHGFVSWAALPGGGAALIWLDGRETGGDATAGGHGHGGGAMALRAALVGTDGRLGEETLLDDRVCDCCNTDLAVAEDGCLTAVYRDRSETEIRDIVTARFEGGRWEPGETIHADGWKIDGCPVNGPAVDRRGDRVVVAWYTVSAGDRSHVRAAFSEDAGRSYGPILELGAADPLGRVDVALSSDGSEARVVWFEAIPEGKASLELRRVTAKGTLGTPVTIATTDGSRASGFPRLARLAETWFVAWTDPEAPRVRTALVR